MSRERVVSIARGFVGEQDPDRFWAKVQPALLGQPHSIAWCGGFALFVLHEAGLCDWEWQIWKGPGTPSGFLYKLPITSNPQPGDIVYFDKKQHHAIATVIYTSGPVETVDGNTLPYPREGVTERVYSRGEGMHFYSIEPLLKDEERATSNRPGVSIAPPMPTIRRGDSARHEESAVKLMQGLLNKHGNACFADGVWGPKTDAALYEFQTFHGLITDRVCGPRTWEALFRDP